MARRSLHRDVIKLAAATLVALAMGVTIDCASAAAVETAKSVIEIFHGTIVGLQVMAIVQSRLSESRSTMPTAARCAPVSQRAGPITKRRSVSRYSPLKRIPMTALQGISQTET